MPRGHAEPPGCGASRATPDVRTGDQGGDGVVIAVFDPRQLAGLVQPFGGRVSCHVPTDRPFSYTALARPDDGRDRWGASGTRTVYLAGDPSVALAEYARHRIVGAPSESRCLCSFRLQAVSVLDLRTDATAALLGRPSMDLVVDRHVARAVSRAVRDSNVCQGLIVPSMAFLDRPDRFNVVLFVERLGVDLESLLTDRETVGEMRLDGA
jgi:RES domain-containing protein